MCHPVRSQEVDRQRLTFQFVFIRRDPRWQKGGGVITNEKRRNIGAQIGYKIHLFHKQQCFQPN